MCKYRTRALCTGEGLTHKALKALKVKAENDRRFEDRAHTTYYMKGGYITAGELRRQIRGERQASCQRPLEATGGAHRYQGMGTSGRTG